MRRAAAFVAVFAAGTVASRVLILYAPQNLAIDRAQPLPVATAWGGFGTLSLLLLAATLLAAFVPYARLLRNPPSVRVTIGIVATALFAGAFFTPLFSSDVYAYAAYGEMSRIGLNPYAHHVLPAHDAAFAAAIWQWPQLPVCVYGEGFIFFVRSISQIFARAPIALELNALRICAMLSLLLCIAACGAIFADGRRRREAAVFIGCNPVVIWSALEGHNDVLMLAVVLGAIVAARKHPWIGILIAAAAASIKLPALLAAGAVALQHAAPMRRRVAAASLAAAVVIVAAYWPAFAGLQLNTGTHGAYMPLASVAALPWSLVMQFFPAKPMVATVASALFCLAAAFALTYRSRKLPVPDRYLAFALAAWMLIPNPYAWYSLWILPIAACAARVRLRRCAIAVCAIALLRYIPDAVAIPPLGENALMGAVAMLPFIVALLPEKRAIISRSV